RDDGGGKTGQRSDFNNAARREDAHQRREKKIIAGADAARIPGVLPFDHGAEEIELAGRRNFAGISQLGSELAILDLNLLERSEFTDVEAGARGRPRIICERAFYYPDDLEAASAGSRPQDVEMRVKRQVQNLRWPPRLRTPRNS